MAARTEPEESTEFDPALAHGGVGPDGDADLRGRTVGGYVVETRLGAGGMGVVYGAWDAELGRHVALKVLKPSRVESEAARAQMIDESRSAATIEHPHVIPVYAAGEDAGRLYIAMRLVKGPTLREEVRRLQGLAPGRAARIVADVADALAVAHAAGLIHRDVKPSNILLAAGDSVYLSDFGLATPAGTETGGTGSGTAGTVAYMAPEQIRGEPLDERTDVYGLGCVLYESLTGHIPFVGADRAEIERQHLDAPPPRPSTLAPGIPAGFDEVVARALAKRPDDRFQSAAEFAEAVRALRYDVLLVASDPAEAAVLAERLREAGLDPAVAARPGVVEEEMRSSLACAFVVGRAGLGSWSRRALDAAERRSRADPAFRMLTVLSEGAPPPNDPSLAALGGWPWVDLREGTSEGAVRTLARMVEGGHSRRADQVSAQSPYPGLAAFDSDGARFFVGRESEVAEAAERLAARRFLAVLGPSGAGKSSLLRAGLVPELTGREGGRADPQLLGIMTPGDRPLDALARIASDLVADPDDGVLDTGRLRHDPTALASFAAERGPGGPDTHRPLLVVNQLEEVFTLCRDVNERRAFLDAITHAATVPGGDLTVVVALRADFYQRCAEHPRLRALMSESSLLLGPMQPSDLKRAIEEPAARAGLELDPRLADTVVEDVGDRAAALPLVGHVMREVWERRQGRLLTLDAYIDAGRVDGALARHAESVLAGLDAEEAARARRILLRLTQPGEGTEDTRRQAEVGELAPDAEELPAVEAVLGKLADGRLVVVGHEEATGRATAEISHEALLRHWPRLRAWIDEARDRLTLERRLSDQARQWERGDREEGLLYRGALLARWSELGTAGLNPLEREFLAASREREDAEGRSRRRRRRVAFGGLLAALVIVAAVAALALRERSTAIDERDTARSQQLAADAELALESDSELAVLLALEAMDIQRTPEAERALRQATHESAALGVHDAHDGSVADVAIGPDGRIATAGSDGAVVIWDGGASGDPTLVRVSDAPLEAVAWGTAGRVLAAGEDGRVHSVDPDRGDAGQPVRLGPPVTALDASGAAAVAGDLDGGVTAVSSGAPAALPGHAAPVAAVAVLPDGDEVASVDEEGVLRVSALSPPRPIARVRLDGEEPPVNVAWAGGDVLVADGGGGLVRAMRADGFAPGEPIVIGDFGTKIATSSDGALIAAGGPDGVVRVLPADGREPIARLRGHSGGVNALAFDEMMRRLATASSDGTARVWDVERVLPARLARPEPPPLYPTADVAFVDGGAVRAAWADGSLRDWAPGDPQPRVALGPDGAPPVAMDFAAGAPVAVGAGGDGSVVTITEDGATSAADRLEVPANSVAVSSDGAVAATGGDDGVVTTWDVDEGAIMAAHRGHAGPVIGVALSADGERVASASRDGTVRVWPARGEGDAVVFEGHEGPVFAVAFSPDGEQVVSGGADRSVRVFDAATGAERAVLRGHQGIVVNVNFDRSGTRVLSSGFDNVRSWSWQDEESLVVFRDTPAGVASAFDANGERIVVSSIQDFGLVVTACDACGPIDEVRDLAEQRVTRTLTDQERESFSVPED